MNKQILLILVLAVAWTFSAPAAPGPTDPAGAPPATETDAPPSPDAGAGTEALPTPTPAPKPPPTRARKPPRRSTRPNFEARSSSSRPSSKTPCGKTSAAPFSALPGEPTWRTTGPSFPPKPASTASVSSRPSAAGPTARRSWMRPTGRLWSGWSVSRGPPPGPGRPRLPAGAVEARPHPGRDRPPLQRRGRPPAALPLPVDLQGQGGFGQRLPGGEDHHGRAGPPGADQPVLGKIEWRLASSSDGS